MKEKPVEMVMLYDFYGAMLTEKQRSFFDLYYNEDLSLAEIAENEGITRQGVRDAILRAENVLNGLEEKLGLYRRSTVISRGLEDIAAAAQSIRGINSEKFLSTEIDDKVREILERIKDITE